LQRRLGWVILGVVLFAGAGLVVLLASSKAKVYDGPTAVAKKKRLQVTIVERGTLESAENSDIICRVRATTRGSSTASHIKWVIADGTNVERGEKLIELDDSALQEQLRDQDSKVAEAKAAWISKKENLIITLSLNSSDLEKAKTDKILAEIDLRKYVGDLAAAQLSKIQDRTKLQRYLVNELEKDYLAEAKDLDGRSVSEFVQFKQEIEGRIEIARSDREMWLDRSAWSTRMVKKGLLMRSQADSDKFRLESADINLRKVQAELDILRKFSLERMVTDLWSKALEGERALERVKAQNISRETLARAEMESKQSVFEQELQKQREIEDDLRKCVIYSPQAGMVVYYVPESSRFGSSSNQNLIQEGEPVREGQKMMRIPNLSRMMVSTRVHEAMVSKIRGEKYKATGFSDALRGGMLTGMPDLRGVSSMLAYNLEVKEQYRDQEATLEFAGLPAIVKVDAFSTKKYDGYVKTVATVASQADFLASEVKVYTTSIAIDGSVDKLKPGMSAEVTILAEETGEEVLTVPIQAVVGTISMGAKRKCFVVHENGRTEERDIEVGLSNDKEVEVKSGLKEGEQVALNTRVILGDKSDMKAASPGKQRGEDGGKKGKQGGGAGRPTGGGSGGADPKTSKGGAGGGGSPGLQKKE